VSSAGSQLLLFVFRGGIEIMCLDFDDHQKWFEITKNLSTERLHNLDIYWRDNFQTSVDQEMHSMVEFVLKERGEKTLEMKRQEQINELNKSLKVSNPVGRIISDVKCLFNKSSKAS